MTIGHKTKSKITKIFKKYGNNLTITDKNNKSIATFGSLSNSAFKKNVNEPF